jgi:hypothetical protein
VERLLHKFIGNTVTIKKKKKLIAHRCKQQLKQLNRCSILLPCTHQANTRLRRDFATIGVRSCTVLRIRSVKLFELQALEELTLHPPKSCKKIRWGQIERWLRPRARPLEMTQSPGNCLTFRNRASYR